MNTHKHARLTFARRLEMVKQMTLQGLDASQAGALQGVTAQTARKWLGRYLSGGEAALADASSRPICSPKAICESKALLIVWETLFVAIDDHARIAFTAMHPDEKAPQAVAFLRSAVAYYEGLGVSIKRLLTDNGAAFRSREFAAACKALGAQHKFTRPYQPQTNGKAERFIQSALREWAYGWTYQNSAERTQALHSWQHHYNWHRPHSGIGRIAPMARLKSANNLLTVHT